jgi:small GTP-binding protein
MGLSFSSLFNLWTIKEARICLIGLDNAGKTAFLNKMAENQVGETVPTVGFTSKEITYKNIKFGVFDIGGQTRLRALWKNFYSNSHGVIFMVDSNDRDRIRESAVELHNAIGHADLKHATLLIYANKQDLPLAVSVAELSELLKVRDLQTKYPDRKIFVQGCCATNGKGLFEGLDFLAGNLPSDKVFLNQQQ